MYGPIRAHIMKLNHILLIINTNPCLLEIIFALEEYNKLFRVIGLLIDMYI